MGGVVDHVIGMADRPSAYVEDCPEPLFRIGSLLPCAKPCRTKPRMTALGKMSCCANSKDEWLVWAVCCDDPRPSDFHPLRDGQRIFELNAEVAHGAVQFCVTQQKLNRAQVAGVEAGRPQMFRSDHLGVLEPSRDGLARPFGVLETDRLTGFALDDRSAMLDLSGSVDVSDFRPYQVAAAQLTVDGKIE